MSNVDWLPNYAEHTDVDDLLIMELTSAGIPVKYHFKFNDLASFFVIIIYTQHG